MTVTQLSRAAALGLTRITPEVSNAAIAAKLRKVLSGMTPGPLKANGGPVSNGTRYTAPNGHPLFPVGLNTPSVPTAPHSFGLVDPLANQVYFGESGGFVGATRFSAPQALPPSVHFHPPANGKFTATALTDFERAANPTLPKAATLKIYNANLGKMGWHAKAPSPNHVLSRVELKQGQGPNAERVSALLLDSNKVVFEYSVRGRPSYSKPFARS